MIANFEDDSEENRILRQLKDMFSSIPDSRLHEVCKENNWHLDSCIDQLMNMVDDAFYNMNDEQLSEPQQQCSTIIRNNFEKKHISKDEERIGSLIKRGYRVLILMRGPPGVGKSYLARYIVKNFVNLENNNYCVGDFVCSSDDYFYNAKGVYNYKSAHISDAHEYNNQRVRKKAQSGLSPIIVDNTSMQIWEMLPYVKYAVENNYLIEILEPKTPWRHSPVILAKKNTHGVSRYRIQQMLDKYEKCSVDSLTKMLKTTKYTKILPQMRLQPPLHATPINSQIVQNADNSSAKEKLIENGPSHVWDGLSTNPSKEQRTKFKLNRSQLNMHGQQDSSTSSTRNVYSLLKKKTTNAWKPFESESADYWGITHKTKEQQFLQLKDACESSCREKSLLDLLREDSNNATNELQILKNATSDMNSFERHSIDCPNENSAFVSLRQIYPNKNVSGLWDLFVKCNGDIDWAVDILLKEDDLGRIRDNDYDFSQPQDDEEYECLCNGINRKTMPGQYKSNSDETSTETIIKDLLNPATSKPQRQRPRFSRSNHLTNPALLQVKENIENCFVLGDDQYSQHVLKIRNIRSCQNEESSSSNNITNSCEQTESVNDNICIEYEDLDKQNQNEDDDIEEDNESHDFNEDMLEMALGEHLIQQLTDAFRNESLVEETLSCTLPANLKVFMPRSLAKQLYMLWVESAFNHMEEERQKLIREDEDFARLLKNPKYSEFKQSPSNLQEILNMEYAWKIYNQDRKEQQNQDIDLDKVAISNDLASHLTQMKLCEEFPKIPRETMLDILATNNNDYNTTVSVLRSTMQMDDVSITQEHTMEYAGQERDVVNQQTQNQMDQRQKSVKNNWEENEKQSNLSTDEAKRLALREFEESRNLAAHHCQLKAECYQKAKESIQNGNGGAAIYYSQIANLHIKKIDMYNHRAANCIMDVHKNTQNNPDLLDLHYLYLIEALGCLDLFLDRHITGLRIASRNYKHVFIITGRGKHSAGGVSTIKNKVKARLKERCLRWSEVNPGLLKVKIFSGSRHSKNI